MPWHRIGVFVVVALLLVAAEEPNDPLIERAYHLDKVGAFDAWSTTRGRGAVVAVVDTGVDRRHEDLRGQFVPGVDLVDDDDAPDDPNGHGTLVAGIIAAIEGNGEGTAGTAPRTKIMPVRVLDEDGSGRSDVVAEGIHWAVDHGADVINLSLADVPGQQSITSLLLTDDVEEAIRDAWDAGVVTAVAAGNDGESEVPYDDDLPALVVGATDRQDRVWEDSNHDKRTLFAPGVEIPSAYRSGYAVADGTSFATPIVAAGAGLLIADGKTAPQARRRLLKTATPIGSGRGRVDIAAAVGTRPPQTTRPPSSREPAESESPDGQSQDGSPRPASESPPDSGGGDDSTPEEIMPLEVPAEPPREPTEQPPRRRPGPDPQAAAETPAAVGPAGPRDGQAAPPLGQPAAPAPRRWPWLALIAAGLIALDSALLAGWMRARRDRSRQRA